MLFHTYAVQFLLRLGLITVAIVFMVKPTSISEVLTAKPYCVCAPAAAADTVVHAVQDHRARCHKQRRLVLSLLLMR